LSDFTIAAAADNAEARKLLVGATAPNASPTQLQLFSPEHIDRALGLGFRRAEWVWAARDGDTTLGVIAGWGSEHRSTPRLLDFLDASAAGDARDVVALALLERAARDSVAADGSRVELIHFLPSDTVTDDPDVAWLIGILERAGFRMLVRRRRYRFQVSDAHVRAPSTSLRFEPIAGPTDPRLVQVLAEILVGSLDAHDISALANADLDRVARETAVEYLEIDPAESVFLAFDPEGTLVGLVVGGLRGAPSTTGTNGTASFIGVSHLHRGHGYAAQLLGWITERMIAAGAETIVGETDDDNFPMARAFAAVGYPQTEARIDFQSTAAS
jgi:GNAT superfamily N-acetyltransferase